MLIVDAPSAFWLLWRAVKPFIQEKTAAKIEFVTWSDAPQRYKELLGPTVADRLVSEGVWLQHCDARTRPTARHVCTRFIPDNPAPCFAGLENRSKASVAAKRWSTFYAPDLVESLSSECAGPRCA